VMEMGPVLTALVIAGRIGASMTAEIGTMKVTEQVDALRTMALDPVRHIVMPRFLGLSLMMPVLAVFSVLSGVLGAYVVSDYFLDVGQRIFLDSIRTYFQLQDLVGGILKSLIFGMLISLIGCHLGLGTSGGARGVGRATIQSFVVSAIFILIGDFFLWLILF
jgi:phospholipid/cholesterol/gamma-HCH transport system permease protein